MSDALLGCSVKCMSRIAHMMNGGDVNSTKIVTIITLQIAGNNVTVFGS